MRLLTVLVALLATPLLTAVSQGKPASANRSRKEVSAPRKAAPRPAAAPSASTAGDCVQQGQHQGSDAGCGDALPPPPPPPPPVSSTEIHGFVFRDLNMNGVLDPGEAGEAGVTVLLDGGAQQALTDASGNYAVTSVTPGTHTVCELQRFGFMQTFPSTGVVCASGEFGYSVPISQGQVVPSIDFGNF